MCPTGYSCFFDVVQEAQFDDEPVHRHAADGLLVLQLVAVILMDVKEPNSAFLLNIGSA